MRDIMKWAEGNPGALNFLMTVFATPDSISLGKAAQIDSKIRQCDTLRGTNLYVLYSDLCDKDLDKVAELCAKCPNEILEDACSRQNYSGRELVKEYLED